MTSACLFGSKHPGWSPSMQWVPPLAVWDARSSCRYTRIHWKTNLALGEATKQSFQWQATSAVERGFSETPGEVALTHPDSYVQIQEGTRTTPHFMELNRSTVPSACARWKHNCSLADGMSGVGLGCLQRGEGRRGTTFCLAEQSVGSKSSPWPHGIPIGMRELLCNGGAPGGRLEGTLVFLPLFVDHKKLFCSKFVFSRTQEDRKRKNSCARSPADPFCYPL
ncbi:uncharacterized protein ACIB01_016195 [Guaruba guarouba]